MQTIDFTSINGSSVWTERQENKLKLYTEAGKEVFKRKSDLFSTSKKLGTTSFYLKFLETEFFEVEKTLTEFIYDDTMVKQFKMNEEDQEGWDTYHFLLDQHNVLKYFLKKIH